MMPTRKFLLPVLAGLGALMGAVWLASATPVEPADVAATNRVELPPVTLLLAQGPVEVRALAGRPAGENLRGNLQAISDRMSHSARAGTEPSAASRTQQLAYLEQYLVDWPDSPYNPEVRAALAQHYVRRLKYAEGIRHWSNSYASLRLESAPAAKAAADQALALWSRHLLIAGQYEELGRVLADEGSRPLDYGPLSAAWGRTREKWVRMGRHPEHSYKCGVFALAAAGRQAGLKFDWEQLVRAPSPTNGFSLAELQELAQAAGLAARPVRANAAEILPVPSVAHLRDGHFVAVLSVAHDRCRIYDPGLKAERQLEATEFAEVASGHFLVLAAAPLPGTTDLTLAQAQAIRGRTVSCPPNDDEDGGTSGGPCEPDDGTTTADHAAGAEPPTCEECGCDGSCPAPGMVTWKVSEPYINLWLTDVPLRYQPTKGPRVAPRVVYKQRAENGPPGLSGTWMLGWFSRGRAELGGVSPLPGNYSNPDNLSQFTVIMPSGASRTFAFPLETTVWDSMCGCWRHYYGDVSTPAPDGARAYKEENNTIVIRLADGRAFAYEQGAVVENEFRLKALHGRDGLGLTFSYPEAVDLPNQLTDADGRTTALTYTMVGSHTLLHRVTTPDNNYCEFTYATFGGSGTPLLTGIRDAVGIVSTIGYVAQGMNYVPQTLTTPYGTTTFEALENVSDAYQVVFSRVLKVTRPDGSREFFALSEFGAQDAQGAWSPPSVFSGNQLPVGAPDPNTGDLNAQLPHGTIKTTYRHQQNSFHWQEPALARIAATTGLDLSLWQWKDMKRARIQHWLNEGSAGEHLFNVLSHRQEPSPAEDANGEPMEGGITFFDYAAKSHPELPGSRNWPSVTLRRLPGVSDSTWRYEGRDGEGKILSRKSAYTLANGTRGIRVDATFEYDAYGNVLREKDAAGLLRREYQWNAHRRRTLQRDYHVPAANSSNPAHYYETTFHYDAPTQRMTQRVAPTGLTTSWAYSGGGNPGSYTEVETQSPLTVGTNAAASRQQTSVIVDGLMTSHTDWRGLTRTFQYDGLGRLKKTTWPDGTYTETTFTRTVNGQPQMILDPVTVRDRLGNLTSYTYDGLRRRLTVKDARNHTTAFTYCACGAVDTVTDPLGNKTVYGYDYAARRTSAQVLKPDQTVVASTTYAYDLLNRLASQTDAAGTRTFSYNHQGLTVGVTQDGKLFGRTKYDADDRAATVVDRNGVEMTQTFDGLGRLKTRTDPNGGVSTYNYSARGLTSLVNELNKTTTYNYDAAGRKTSEVTPNNETVSYTYNAAGDLLTLTDGRGKVTTWTYDAGNEGRLWKKKYASDAFDQTIYGYNAGGQLTSRRYYSNASTFAETLYTYDNNGNVTLVNYPVGTTDITLVYDANNRVTSMTDASGTTAYTYTAWGALLTEDGPWTGTTDRLTYAYDLARRRTGLTLDQPGGGTFAHTYGYDAAGRMNSVVSPAATTAYGFLAASYAGNNYASDRRTLIDYPGAMQVDQDFTDPLKRLKSTTLRHNGSVSNSHAYVYNAGSQRTKQTLTDGSYVDYAYDHLGQLDTALTKFSNGNPVTGQQFDYAYDAGWNLTTRATGSGTTTYVPNDRNQLSTAGGWAQGYDAAGNRTSESTGTTSSLSYTYDAENQLTSVAIDSYGTPEGSRWKLEFTYDGRGRLRKRVDYFWLSGTGWYANGDTRYVYDGMLLLQQRSGGNVPQVSYTRGPDLSGSLAGAGGIGGLLARSTHSSTSPYPLSTTAFYHADGNGNVTYLLRSDAGAHARYQYDPYGRTLSATGTLASANLLRFSSKPVVLSATGSWGCYYYGYRFYDPNTQRWLNRDPLGEAGGVNLYGFVWNNPTTYSDPDGQAPHAWVARGAFLVGSMIGDYLYDEFVDPMLDDYFATHVDPEVAANLNRARAALDAARAARNVGKLALNGAKLLKQCAAKSAGANLGRTGKQARLHELADDPNVSSADRGWIRQEQNSIARGQRDTIRNPPGKDLAHERGREAAKGYSYEHSNLQDRDLHRTQHKFDDFSRANAERPLRPDER